MPEYRSKKTTHHPTASTPGKFGKPEVPEQAGPGLWSIDGWEEEGNSIILQR
jgi:hypothetical protein